MLGNVRGLKLPKTEFGMNHLSYLPAFIICKNVADFTFTSGCTWIFMRRNDVSRLGGFVTTGARDALTVNDDVGVGRTVGLFNTTPTEATICTAEERTTGESGGDAKAEDWRMGVSGSEGVREGVAPGTAELDATTVSVIVPGIGLVADDALAVVSADETPRL